MNPESGRTLEPGRILGHYRLLERIGAGGMGEVWRAHDERLRRDVALKLLLPGLLADESARRQFRHEALALSRLNHPHVATLFEFGREDGLDFLVMEYVGGEQLGAASGRGPLEESEVVRLGLQLAEGLAAAHAEGVVHRDLKPANVRLTSSGRLKLLDFGLAHLAHPGGDVRASWTAPMTEPGTLVGTLRYMAPEQVRGQAVDARTDVWAAGLVLYEFSAGVSAYEGLPLAMLVQAILSEPLPAPRRVNPRISRGLEAIILRCVEKDPARRYGSAQELAADLERLRLGQRPRAQRRAGARRLMLGLAITAAALATAALVGDLGGIRSRLAGRPTLRTIGVLPLANLSADPDQAFLADGITEMLISDLGQVGSLRVLSRTSTERYRGQGKRLRDIARELGADALVEGSVVRSGDRVRVTARLVHAAGDRQVWTQSYERDLRDMLFLQSDVALAIARQIQATLTPGERLRLGSARSVDPRAHEAYLRGVHVLVTDMSGEGSRAALGLFEEATRLAPDYALAYVGLSSAYDFMGGVSMPPALAVPRARAAALRAIEIDSLLPDARVALGKIQFNWEWDWAGAERELQRAIELNPSFTRAHVEYASLMRCLGRYPEDLEQVRISKALDPLDRYIAIQTGWAHYFGGEFAAARREFEDDVRLAPDMPQAHAGLGLALEQLGDHARAVEQLTIARAMLPDADYSASLVHALAAAGRPREARALLDSLVTPADGRPLPAYPQAIAWAGLGEPDRALQELRRAVGEPNSFAMFMKVDPRLQPLRGDPRYREVLGLANLAD